MSGNSLAKWFSSEWKLQDFKSLTELFEKFSVLRHFTPETWYNHWDRKDSQFNTKLTVEADGTEVIGKKKNGKKGQSGRGVYCFVKGEKILNDMFRSLKGSWRAWEMTKKRGSKKCSMRNSKKWKSEEKIQLGKRISLLLLFPSCCWLLKLSLL